MGIAFVIFMAICIKCFSIHTPSSNPRLAKRVHLAETLRRPVRALRQKVILKNEIYAKEFGFLKENEKYVCALNKVESFQEVMLFIHRFLLT